MCHSLVSLSVLVFSTTVSTLVLCVPMHMSSSSQVVTLSSPAYQEKGALLLLPSHPPPRLATPTITFVFLSENSKVPFFRSIPCTLKCMWISKTANLTAPAPGLFCSWELQHLLHVSCCSISSILSSSVILLPYLVLC